MAHKILFICVFVFLKEIAFESVNKVKEVHSLMWAGIFQSTEGLVEKERRRKDKLSFLSCDVHFLLPLDIRAPVYTLYTVNILYYIYINILYFI